MPTVTTPKPAKKSSAPRQVVFSFNEGAPETRTAAIRGGKGASLATMTALGLPVPPGFTVTTTVARAFSQTGQLPKRVTGQFVRAMRNLERQTGKEFGNPDNPLLVSVRSGAKASFAGMMDTVLNVGLNPSTVAGLARLQGEQFALDAYCRFLVQFGAVVLGVPPEKLEYVINSTKAQACEEHDRLSKTCERLRFAIELMTERPVPDDVEEQLELSMNAVLASWTSARAVAYRQVNGLPSWWGTAATVQQMVFGNRSDASGTGVVFSHDVTTGQPGLYGDFLPNAQGEDVVAGTCDPLPLSALAEWNPSVYRDLEHLVALLVDHIGDIVDVEFTVEDGELYLLQVRPAKRSALASVTYAVHQVWAGCMTREQALKSVPSQDVDSLQRQEFDFRSSTPEPCLRGIPASPGAAVGRVVTSSAQAQEWAARGEQVILVTRDTTPDDLPGMLCAQALITGNGGPTSHAAVVAREQNLPAVVGVGEASLLQLQEGRLVSVDGTAGDVYDTLLSFTHATFTKETQIFLKWAKRFVAYQPRIGFEWCETQQNVNNWLNDFYLSDLMTTVSKGSALESAASELRNKIHRGAAEMLVAYLAIAVAGELRYANGYVGRGDSDTELRTLSLRYGVTSPDRSAVHRSAMERLQTQDLGAHIEFFRLAESVFGRPGWIASFGGKAWAKIARAGFMFLSGTWTPTVFVDHVFDLRHNGGRLFDKHSMVGMTMESTLVQQLNVKKVVDGVSELYRELRLYASYSDSVEALYRDGLNSGLWSLRLPKEVK